MSFNPLSINEEYMSLLAMSSGDRFGVSRKGGTGGGGWGGGGGVTPEEYKQHGHVRAWL